MNVSMTVDGSTFVCSARQAATIQTLVETQKGGFASVRGYVSTSKRVSPETADMTVLTRFSVSRLYDRRIKALQAVTLDAILPILSKSAKVPIGILLTDKVYFATITEAFNARKATEIASLQKTLDGVRDDAQRAAHDRNYARIGDGVKVHFVCEKNADGKMIPVLNADGIPTVQSIMLSVIEIAKNVLVEGEYKTVNSGMPVLIGNAIQSVMPKSTKIKMLSLKDDNFTSITIDNETVLPKDIAGDFTG